MSHQPSAFDRHGVHHRSRLPLGSFPARVASWNFPDRSSMKRVVMAPTGLDKGPGCIFHVRQMHRCITAAVKALHSGDALVGFNCHA